MAGVTKALVAVENENFHGDCVFCCELICGLQQTFTFGVVCHIPVLLEPSAWGADSFRALAQCPQ